MARRVEGDDHLDRLTGSALGADHQAVLVGEAHRLRGDVEDVGVLGDGPERLVALGFEPRHRRLGPELGPHVVGVAALGVARRVAQVEWIDGVGVPDAVGHDGLRCSAARVSAEAGAAR